MERIIECVPNFSEGRDMAIIEQITQAIRSVEGVRLLDVDPGKDTNRTVVTFVGPPEAVVEGAFRGIRKASELIDMSKHKGEHPRFGATDVCPLVPVAGVSMEETVEHARALARRVGQELGISVYCYEHAAFEDKRRNLANCRAGQYEGLAQKLADPAWKPDFGPDTLNVRSGASAIGARDFLVAYNFNLNTTSVRRANAIAFDVREAGRTLRDGKNNTGKILRDEAGKAIKQPGTLKKTKAIGWYIEEYGQAQISMNITDISVTPLHVAFDEVSRAAQARGIRVTGSELVGLVPKKALLEAGRHYLRKQERSTGVSEQELVRVAVKSLGLDDLRPFEPRQKVIEYLLEDDTQRRLSGMTLSAFADETASESPAPGGGSVSAYLGALGAALGTMVANLSAHKRGWDERWEYFSDWAEQGQRLNETLQRLVDRDTAAFDALMAAFGLPKASDEEKQARKQAIQRATLGAAEVPLEVMRLCAKSFDLLEAMAEQGNPNSVTDVGVGALAARSAVLGAFLNVRVNLSGLADRALAERMLAEGQALRQQAEEREARVLALVDAKLA